VSMGEVFLRRLFDEMMLQYRVGREERRKQLREKYGVPVVFVHELLECGHKREMRRRFPEVEAASIYNPRFVVGWLVEEGVKRVLGVKEDQHYWEKPVELPDGKPVVIAGSIDARDPETGKVIEIKYLSGLYGSPHEHHQLQLGLYLWGVGEPEGELWMISPEGIISTPVKALSEDQVQGLAAEYFANDPPTPRYDWECRFCPFESFCPYSKRREKK